MSTSDSIDTPDPSKTYSSLLYPHLSDEDISVLTEFFQYVDTNQDGFITVDEIRNACAMDINHDGVISEMERDQTARVWLRLYLDREDVEHTHTISLGQLLQFNDRYVGRSIHFRTPLANR